MHKVLVDTLKLKKNKKADNNYGWALTIAYRYLDCDKTNIEWWRESLKHVGSTQAGLRKEASC